MLTTATVSSVSARKTAFRHFSAYIKSPIPGVTMTQIDPDTFHVTSRVMDGVYMGIMIHWELKITDTYPYSPPFGQIVDGYKFDEEYHHHVFQSRGICADFLGNFAYLQHSAGAGTGWTSACDFLGLMINMQAFFADPDGRKVNQKQIADLMSADKRFACKTCPHSTAAPFPPMSLESSIQSIVEVKEDPILSRARKHLFCSVSKENVVDDKDVCLGYPVSVSRDRFQRVHATVMPELLSFEAYGNILMIAESQGLQMLTASGHTFTNWLPIYSGEERFAKYLSIAKTTISVIAKGPGGKSSNDFQPAMVLQVLPALMNQQVVQLMKGDIHESESAILSFVHLLRLFKRMIKEFPSLQKSIDDTARAFLQSPAGRMKKTCGDIGEFLIKLSLTSNTKEIPKTFSYDNPVLRKALLHEYFARQIRWIRKDHPGKLVKLSINRKDTPQMQDVILKDLFQASVVSNRLLVFNLEMTRTFIIPNFESLLDRCYGIPPQSVIEKFQERVKLVKSKLNSYSDMMQAISFANEITGREPMLDFLRHAVALSASQKYD